MLLQVECTLNHKAEVLQVKNTTHYQPSLQIYIVQHSHEKLRANVPLQYIRSVMLLTLWANKDIHGVKGLVRLAYLPPVV